MMVTGIIESNREIKTIGIDYITFKTKEGKLIKLDFETDGFRGNDGKTIIFRLEDMGETFLHEWGDIGRNNNIPLENDIEIFKTLELHEVKFQVDLVNDDEYENLEINVTELIMNVGSTFIDYFEGDI